MVMPKRRERVLPRLIEDEMRESFIDYSMSVIVQRALPDVRDGLKPVHRRILYAMYELGLLPGRPYKKSASVVGEVLGKYHPHGDAAVYDSLVRMVQDFSLRYPLVDGQGNFGSIDGDNAAAYRYTEARLTPIAMELLEDLEKGTVDFVPNFDDRLQEPTVLPAKLPNLLVNGSSGIAVGMATNIPPHNLREVAAAIKHLVAHPDCSVDELMRHIKGPDFPTGGFIVGLDGIKEAYRTGRGRIIMRARIQRESLRNGKEQLVVTELPYGISKARVVEQIAQLVRERKLEDIADLRDESDREGMRVVIELRRGAQVPRVLTTLFKNTALQATFGAILLALDNGVPREMNLKEILERYRDHRLEVIQRRARFELERAQAEAHITEGLLVALDNIDAVIRIIRRAQDREVAAAQLRKRFRLSEAQAGAILDMRLARLTALEHKALKQQVKALERRIADLEKLLGSRKRQLALLVAELDELVERYGDARRTRIVKGTAELPVEDLIAQENVVVTLTHEGYINRVPLDLYRRRVRRGTSVLRTKKGGDFLERAFIAGTRDTLLVFTQDGLAHALPVHKVPEASTGRGTPLVRALGLGKRAAVAAMIPVADFSADRHLVFLTAGGVVKRTTLDQFAGIRAGGITAMGIRKGDRLLDVQLSDGTNDVVIVTRQGRAIRFPEAEIPAVGRAAQGVRGINLREGDRAIGMVVVRRDASLCTITENGYAKRTPIGEYAVQRRGGVGAAALAVDKRTGPLVAVEELLPGDELMVLTAKGAGVRVAADDLPEQRRTSKGKRVLEPEPGDRVVEVARIVAQEEGGEAKGARKRASRARSGQPEQLSLIGVE